MTCQRCQRVVPDGSAFCPACGARTAGTVRRLARDRANAKLAGVCGGLATYFDVDPTLMRVIYLAATFFTGFVPGALLYIVLALVMPME